MRTNVGLRPAIAAGALTVAIGIPAVALAAGTSQAQSATVIKVNHTRFAYGGKVSVTGTAGASAAGQRLELDFAPRGSSWTPVATTTVGSGGGFRLSAKLYRSGLVRVSAPVTATAASSSVPAASASAIQPSASQPVTVHGRFVVNDGRRNLLGGGGSVVVKGRLLPELAGRTVTLQARNGGAWRTVGHARTRTRGRFTLRFTSGGLGTEQLRVRFSGDKSSARTQAASGLVTVYQQTVASWYDDGGSTACGFHAGMGVANKTLPCGSKVTFVYGGRTVTATVDDRGPFVAGRTWDLNQNTAAALGVAGVATVWSSQ